MWSSLNKYFESMSCKPKQSEENSQSSRTVRFALPDPTISSSKHVTGIKFTRNIFSLSILLINWRQW